MKSRARVVAAAAAFFLLIPVCGFSPGAGCADMIVTSAPVYEPLAALRGGERFPRGAELLLVHEGKAEPLVTGFAASADANVSFDGKKVLFAGKQTKSDPWQIYELTLATRAVRKAVTTETDAIRPLYLPTELPEGRVVYAMRTKRGFELENARLGELPEKLAKIDPYPALMRVTYMGGSAIPSDVLADGRILFEAAYPLGSKGVGRPVAELYLVYQDGSGVESYRCDHGTSRWGGTQLADGDVVFTHGAGLARFTSPMAHEAAIAAPRAEYAGGIAELATGEWLVSARAAAGGHYALKMWKRGAAVLAPMMAENGKDLVEPVVVGPRAEPNRHPTALHKWSYANLLALDARLSREGDLKTAPAALRLETEEADGRVVVNGTAPVESDGSFFVRVPGDKPIRFALVDKKGTAIRQEHGWFWIRSGEQRICVGCHTGPERGSENRVPEVLMKTTTAVDLTGAATPTRGN